MLFYFAPANYLYLFMTPPQASWVSWRLLLRAVIPLAGLTVLIQPSLGYLHSAHDPQPYFNPNNVAAVPVSSLVPEQLFGFPGLTLDLDLAEAHQLVNGACCHLHPAWLAWDHMPPLQPLLTFMMSALGAQCSGIDEVIAAPWQWAQNFSNPGDWSMVVPQNSWSWMGCLQASGPIPLLKQGHLESQDHRWLWVTSRMEHNGPMLPVTDLQTLTMKDSSEEVSVSDVVKT